MGKARRQALARTKQQARSAAQVTTAQWRPAAQVSLQLQFKALGAQIRALLARGGANWITVLLLQAVIQGLFIFTLYPQQFVYVAVVSSSRPAQATVQTVSCHEGGTSRFGEMTISYTDASGAQHWIENTDLIPSACDTIYHVGELVPIRYSTAFPGMFESSEALDGPALDIILGAFGDLVGLALPLAALANPRRRPNGWPRHHKSIR